MMKCSFLKSVFFCCLLLSITCHNAFSSDSPVQNDINKKNEWTFLNLSMGPPHLYDMETKVYGFDLAFLLAGMDFKKNWMREEVRGVQFGGIGSGAAHVNGLQVGGLGALSMDELKGIQLSGSTCYTNELYGIQIGFLSVGAADAKGVQIAGLLNFAYHISGVQFGIINYCDVGIKGFQIGVVNMATRMSGVQIGLVNIIKRSAIPFLPVINVHF